MAAILPLSYDGDAGPVGVPEDPAGDLGAAARRWYRKRSRLAAAAPPDRDAPHSYTFPDDTEACPVANIKSQIKRNRQNEVARERNKAVRTSLKTAVRRFREAADAGDTEKAQEAAKVASRKLDKAVSDGVIHKNQAANRKSAIAKRAASL
jgi:small subunit ribosomal protein S20